MLLAHGRNRDVAAEAVAESIGDSGSESASGIILRLALRPVRIFELGVGCFDGRPKFHPSCFQ